MKKNDKLIAVLGVAILILAAIGIYYWAEEPEVEEIEVDDLYEVYGVLKDLPGAITVSDSDPYYALIATPIAINYDEDGYQNVRPLYIKNLEEPSVVIERTEDQIGIFVDEEITDEKTAKEVSLELATKYWESSQGALVIECSQEGYNLGVLATPLASYFSLPVIVTDEMDTGVRNVLDDLGVELTMVCGDIDGYGDVLRFESVGDVVNASIKVVEEKFDEIDYITITNPIDIHEPKVLDTWESEEWTGTLGGFSLMPSVLGNTIMNLGSAITQSGAELGEVTIPPDYKYALIKFYGAAEYAEPEDPDEFGSHVSFGFEGDYEIFGCGLDTANCLPVEDSNGKIIKDQIYSESVVYDLAGETFTVKGTLAGLFVSDSAEISAKVTIEKLEDPLYPMMKGLSSTAPYLTAYRKGIMFGKPEFAFVADDHVRTNRNEKCPGFYQTRLNHDLQYANNMHVFDVHDQINELLAQIADVDLTDIDGLEELRDHYKKDPVYICLVGGNVVLPQIIYDSYLLPPDPDNYVSVMYGIGVPSDVIYANIDPIPDEWPMTAQDVYWDENENFPYQENILGRITGWDVSEANAMIARTIFYDDIIDNEEYEDWKDTATSQTGAGVDFAKPPVLSFLNQLFGNTEPPKWYTGCSDITGDAIQALSLEPSGFDVLRSKLTESQVEGFSDWAINEMKTRNILSRLLFGKNLFKLLNSEAVVVGGEYMVDSNFIWQNAHGMPNYYEFGDEAVSTLGFRPLLYLITNYISRANVPAISLLMNTGVVAKGTNSIRNMRDMELGPSVMIIESCFCGKIDGMNPKQSASQMPIHMGVNALVASTTESNIPGGYLDPYLEFPFKWDRYNIIGNILTRLDIRMNGAYPEFHFGHTIEHDFFSYLGQDQDTGTALHRARNEYLAQDWESSFQWVPPLSAGGVELAENVPEHKLMAFYEYVLYGDPAFNPYVPNE